MACQKSPSSPGPGYEILICIQQDTSEALKIALLIGYCRELYYLLVQVIDDSCALL